MSHPPSKLVDPVRDRLALCAKVIYGVDVQTFVSSAPGQNGDFVAKDPKGNTFTVENEVARYTKFGLMLLDPLGALLNGELSGLTLSSNPHVNYTASNLAPELFGHTQLHELGHSLDLIIIGHSTEQSAEMLNDCIYERNGFERQK